MSPPAESALASAFTVQHNASLKGFDWVDPVDALHKVREETDEVASVIASARESGESAAGSPADPRLDEELGDLLFAVVNVARLANVDPRPALARAIRKFEARFAEVERLAQSRNLPMPGTPLAELDRIWDEVKADPQ